MGLPAPGVIGEKKAKGPTGQHGFVDRGDLMGQRLDDRGMHGEHRVEEMRKTDPLRRQRPIRYLNNILEQDHRAIKRRVKAKQGFREFHGARRTIQGYEAIHMIRKGQTRRVSVSDVRRQIQFINKLFGVAA